MGIKGLTNVIRKEAPVGIEITKITSLKGKRVVIDMSLVAYQCLIGRFNSVNLMDKEGNTTSHISGIMYRFAEYLRQGIIPIGVFDGKPPEEKKITLNARNKEVTSCKDKIGELKQLEQTFDIKQKIISLEKKTVKMTWQHGDDLKKLLKYMGIKTYQANGEAETACVWLVKNNLADTIMTEDMDTLVYGEYGINMTLVRRNVFRDSPPDEIYIFHLDTILDKLELTMEQFVDMCLICGSDYTDSIPRIGSRTAYKYIKKYGTLEKSLEYIRGNNPNPTPTDTEYSKAKDIFKRNYDGIIYNDELESTSIDYDPVKLKNFLLEKNFQEKRINTLIKKTYGV